MIYVAALDNIFVAMKGHRLFDRFGFNLPKSIQTSPSNKQKLSHYETVLYDNMENDWINIDTGEKLVNYKLPSQLHFLLEQNMDNEKE